MKTQSNKERKLLNIIFGIVMAIVVNNAYGENVLKLSAINSNTGQADTAINVASANGLASARSHNRIQAYTENPRYWQYKGEPLLLIGGSDNDDAHNWSKARLITELDLLASVGGNYIRNVVTTNDSTILIHPFKRITSGPNTGKFDLNQWDEVFWSRITNLLDETNARGIITSFEIWNGHGFKSKNWDNSPWNPKNNINYTSAGTGIPESWSISPRKKPESPFVKTVPGQNNIPLVLGFQEKFVKEFLIRTLPYDNVLYVIQNESSTNFDWSEHWATLLQNEATAQGEKIEVSDMRWKTNLTDAEYDRVIKRSDLYSFIEISQNSINNGDVHYNRIQHIREDLSNNPTLNNGAPIIRPMNAVKIYGVDRPDSDSDYGGGTVAAKERFWNNIFAGSAGQRFHRTDIKLYGLGLSTEAQTQIFSARMLTEKFDFFSTEPRNDILSDRSENEAFALFDTKQKIAVYFTGKDNGSVMVNLPVSDSIEWRLQWLNIFTILGDMENTILLQRPGNGQWVALLTTKPAASLATPAGVRLNRK